MNPTKCLLLMVLFSFAATVTAQNNSAALNHWPQWRGPDFNGMARSDAPTKWSDT
ncbi:MAG: hypothetical protein JNM09_31345, partial [Blastocatellia bacterium]|nr:hypothetical protein [Blastocatellia bacterium]